MHVGRQVQLPPERAHRRVVCRVVDRYSCLLRELIAGWRAVWSATPGTTDPAAPFGVVALPSGGSEGGPNMGAMRLAQTMGHGVLPPPPTPPTTTTNTTAATTAATAATTAGTTATTATFSQRAGGGNSDSRNRVIGIGADDSGNGTNDTAATVNTWVVQAYDLEDEWNSGDSPCVASSPAKPDSIHTEAWACCVQLGPTR
jgi:hypothetical protein